MHNLEGTHGYPSPKLSSPAPLCLQAAGKVSSKEQIASVKDELRVATQLMAAASTRVEQVGGAGTGSVLRISAGAPAQGRHSNAALRLCWTIGVIRDAPLLRCTADGGHL